MAGFLLLSFVLHAGLVFVRVPVLKFAGNPDTVLTVGLVTSRANATSQNSRARPNPNERREIMSLPSIDGGMAVPEPTHQTATPSETDGHDKRLDSAAARIQAQLLTDLRRHFEYPSLARRRGWQGTVWLAFTLESDGALQRIHVARSSGYDVLDDSAVAALKRVERLSERHWLNGRAFEMSVPVIYRLKDN